MKRILLILVNVTLILSILGGYLLLEKMFPVAAPIQSPNFDDITEFRISSNNETFIIVDSVIVAMILENICNAEPTRTPSWNDFPTVSRYFTIEIDTSGIMYRYFVYTENSQVYLESPYEGVYGVNPFLLDIVAEYVAVG